MGKRGGGGDALDQQVGETRSCDLERDVLRAFGLDFLSFRRGRFSVIWRVGGRRGGRERRGGEWREGESGC